MNSKSLIVKKDSTPKNDDETAVFVLSPHLLQQLGINLESIAPNHSGILLGKEESAKKNSNDSESANGKGNESSILETASLIKDTVLLSPTFIPTVANTIRGEVEIANVNNELQNDNICKRNIAENVLALKIKELNTDINIIKQTGHTSTYEKYTLSDSTQIGFNDNLKSNTKNQYSANQNIEPAKESLHGQSNCLEKKDDEILTEYECDNIYFSDFEPNLSSETVINIPVSNVTTSDSHKIESLEKVNDEQSNDILHDNIITSDLELNERLTTSNHTLQSKVSGSDLQKNKSDKVNSITEKENATSTIKKLESLTSTPVGIKSLMSHSKDKNINIHEIKRTTKEILDVTLSSLDSNGKINYGDNTKKKMLDDTCYDAQQNKRESLQKSVETNIANRDNIQVKNINNTTYARNKPQWKHLKNYDNPHSLENIEEVHGNNNNNSNDFKEIPNICENIDYVNDLRKDIQTPEVVMEREIGICPIKVFDEEYKSTEHFYISNEMKSSMNLDKCVSIGCKEDSLDPVNSNDIAAEHKQIHDITLKTYKRNKKRQSFVCVDNIRCLGDKILLNVATEAQHENNTGTINLSDSFKSKEFCVCGDFGRLSYYDSDALYEHVHFWKHKTINCNPDIIMSMYDDNLSCGTNSTILDDECFEENSNDSYQHNICWNDLEGREDPSYLNVNVSDLELNRVVSPGQTKLNVDSSKTFVTNKETDLEAKVDVLNKVSTNKTLPSLSKIIVDIKEHDKNEEIRKTIATDEIILLKETKIVFGSKNPKENNVEIVSEANEKLIGNLYVTDKVISPKQIETDINTMVIKKIDFSETFDINKEFVSQNQITRNRDIGADNIKKYAIKNAESPLFKTRECIEFDDSSQFIDETSTCGTNEVGLSIDAKNKGDTKNNYSLAHTELIVDDDVKIQCEIRKSALTKDKTKSSIRKTDQKISVTKEKQINKDVTHKHINEETGKIAKAASKESLVKCGVCKKELKESSWMKHKAEHNYVAWKDTEPPIVLEDDLDLKEYLMKICKENGGLVCCKCGLIRKYVKLYMHHIEKCVGTEGLMDTSASKTDNENDQETESGPSTGDEIVKCGVCQENVKGSTWIKHIGNKHNYLAWVDGTPALDINDDLEVQTYLNNISKQHGGLICSKCGLIRKYVKAYLQHIQICGEYTTSLEEVSCTELVGDALSTIFEKSIFDIMDNNPQGAVVCGVCRAEVQSNDWITHIQSEHNYKAWIEGQPALVVANAVMVRKYLNVISKRIGGLICQKCGLKQNDARLYLKHIEKCISNLKYDKENTAGSSVQCKDQVISPRQIETDINTMVIKKIDISETFEINKEFVSQNQITKNRDIGADNIKKYAIKNAESPIFKTRECIEFDDSSQFIDDTSTCATNEVGLSIDAKNKGDTKNNYSHAHTELIVDDDVKIQCETRKSALTKDKTKSSIRKTDQKKSVTKEKQINKDVTHKHINDETGKIAKKRKSDSQTSSTYNDNTPDRQCKKNIKCGVCDQFQSEAEWNDHVENEHCFIAWKADQTINLKDAELFQKLKQKLKTGGKLKCTFCGNKKKFLKDFLSHVQKCMGKGLMDTSASNTDMNATNENDQETESGPSTGDEIVKCGVCQENVKGSTWIKHIGNKHNYLAWVDGTPALDINDDLEVQTYLNNISKQHGGLICSKCGLIRKYVKAYLQHIQICGEYTTSLEEVSCTELVGDALSTIFEKSIFDIMDNNPQGTVVCGVCRAEVQSNDWITHIQSEHNYKAWIEGQPALIVANAVMVRKYLNVISKRIGGLICQKCGLKQNDARLYLKHIEKCNDNDNAAGSSVQCKAEINTSSSKATSHQDGTGARPQLDEYQCAICLTIVKSGAWDRHAMKKHYNLAWPVGDTPIDLKKPYVVEKYLKEYKRHNNLVCKVCGITRVSCVGFYAHILVCGKTEEEVNRFKEHCEICNNSYLCIYKSQHMTAHREQEYAKERKLKNEAQQAVKKTEETESPSGRRRAAEKARHVIEKYNTNMKNASHTCPSCNLGMESKEELENHKCLGKYSRYSSDSDVSVKLEHCSDDDDDLDDDELVSDDDISNNEEEVIDNKRKRHRESLPPPYKIPRIPFKVSDPDAYLKESSQDFYETHFTSDVLFNEWRNCEYELVSESELSQYLPPLEKSCKIKFGTDSWTTYKRFEARYQKGWCLFAGSCIQCICWAPPLLADAVDSCGHYLAVACHTQSHSGSGSDVDVPRYNYDQIAQHTNAIQIWNIGDFKSSLPKFVFGISHNYGTIWSMDWCPSGARDLLPQTETKSDAELRLGLLAIACSNGYAYIFSVPYPSTVSKTDNNVFYKLKPVAELRVTMNATRRQYQATSICWSPQKGHATVVVGYADGTTAFFDLNCNSPILSCKVNNTTIIYPYEDKRVQNSCLTDVGVYPSTGGVGGVVSNSSVCGAGARVGRGGRALHAHVPATSASFTPHWPAVLLAGDEYIVNLSEVEVGGATRRLGWCRAAAGSARLGQLVAHVPPLLRLMRMHAAYRELQKPIIGLLQMIPIDRKRKRKIKNDELAVTLEPTTYEAAIQKYGIEYTTVHQKDKAEQLKSLSTAKEQLQWVERFPLSDVTSMAFCHSERHQNKLAVALYAGLIFIVRV